MVWAPRPLEPTVSALFPVRVVTLFSLARPPAPQGSVLTRKLSLAGELKQVLSSTSIASETLAESTPLRRWSQFSTPSPGHKSGSASNRKKKKGGLEASPAPARATSSGRDSESRGAMVGAAVRCVRACVRGGLASWSHGILLSA